MFSVESNTVEIPFNSADFRIWLVGKKGNEIKRREFEEVQSLNLDDGVIATVIFGLVAEAFGEKSKENEIKVQIENGPISYETTWEKLDPIFKKGIIDKILLTQK